MALVDKKSNVVNTIGAYTSLKQQGKKPNPTKQFPSVSNSKEVVPYLLGVLGVVAGSFALKQLVGNLFTDFANKVEPELKTAVKKQMIQSNADEPMPVGRTYTMSGSTVDPFNKYGQPVQSPIGDLEYGSESVNFDKKSYEAISNPGQPVTYLNVQTTFDSTNNNFIYKPVEFQSLGAAAASVNIGDFFSNFIDGTTILDKKNFQVQSMNSIFGSVTSAKKKTVAQVTNDLMVEKMIEQLIEKDDDSFEVSQDDYEEIQRKAQDMVNGVLYYDMGCGLMATQLSLEDLTNTINQTANSNDPNAVGDAVLGALDKSLEGNPETSARNKETIQDNFFQRLIKAMTIVLATAAVASPQIRALQGIYTGIVNGAVTLGKIVDDFKKFKVFIKCIIKKAMELINKYIYEIVIAFLIALITPVIKKVVKEKINQYKNTMTSLTGAKKLSSA